MKLLVVLLAAVVLSAAAGLGAVYVTTEWLPSFDDPAGRGMATVYSLFAAALYVLVAAVVFGIAAFRQNRERAVLLAMRALLLAPVIVVALGAMQNPVHFDARKELLGGLQLFAPMWVVVAVQWIVLRWYIRRETAGNAGTTHG